MVTGSNLDGGEAVEDEIECGGRVFLVDILGVDECSFNRVVGRGVDSELSEPSKHVFHEGSAASLEVGLLVSRNFGKHLL